MSDARVILVIEDEAAIAETICYALSTDGFQTHWRSTGQEGIECAAAIHPQLILLDIGLPDSNGFEVFRGLQSRLKNPPAVIFLTARSEEIDRIVGLELGADDYISKPLQPPRIVRSGASSTQTQPAANCHPKPAET